MSGWLGPALLAAVAWRVAAGAPDAAVLVVAAVAAPLAALVALPPRPPSRPFPALAPALGAVAGLALLWADFVALADAGARFGVARWQTATVAGALTLAMTSSPAAERRRAVLGGAALGAVAITLVVLGAGARVAPWTAWERTASRPAIVLRETAAVHDGVALSRGTTLDFLEAHRLTALTAATYRVVEAGEPPVVRDWPLAPGETLALRPGDRLVVTTPASVRLEPGRRVPGAPASGAVWAAPEVSGAPAGVVHALALAVTVVAAAWALPAPRAPLGTALGVPALVVGATAWGVYVADAAPETMLGPPAAALFGPARALTPPGLAHLATALTAVSLLALLVAAARARRGAIAVLAGRRALAAWAAAVVLAAAAAALSIDGWRAVTLALGLAAAVRGAPLAGGRGDAVAVGAGALAGVAVFGAVVGAAAVPPVLDAWPALAAAPVAWATARLVGVLRDDGTS